MIDPTEDDPLSDCTFSLWYYVLDEDDGDTVTFNTSTWTRVGTYSSGSLINLANDTRYPGQFLTNVFEGQVDENGNVIEGVNSNYVFLLVEDNVDDFVDCH